MSRQIITNDTDYIKAVYDRYGAILLGYIYETVRDKETAEQYLIAVFNELATNKRTDIKRNVYVHLQLMARKKLEKYFEERQQHQPDNQSYLPQKPNKYLQHMTEEERKVFCGIHYQGKSISALATELGYPEQVIKKTLQKALAAIRRTA